MFVLACFGFPGRALAAVLIAGLASDLLDICIARRPGTISPSLRYADTLVDAVFYTSAAAATAVSVPGAFDGAGILLILLITVQVSRATLRADQTPAGRVVPHVARATARTGARGDDGLGARRRVVCGL